MYEILLLFFLFFLLVTLFFSIFHSLFTTLCGGQWDEWLSRWMDIFVCFRHLKHPSAIKPAVILAKAAVVERRNSKYYETRKILDGDAEKFHNQISVTKSSNKQVDAGQFRSNQNFFSQTVLISKKKLWTRLLLDGFPNGLTNCSLMITSTFSVISRVFTFHFVFSYSIFHPIQLSIHTACNSHISKTRKNSLLLCMYI